MSKTESLVWDAAEPIAAKAGCSLYDVEFFKEGSNYFLRVTIDKEGGVSTEDCERVSKPLSDWLDEKDPIPQSYFLEVSSPGIERKLSRPEHFAAAIGKRVAVRLFVPINGNKAPEGILAGYENGLLRLSVGQEELALEKAKIVDVRLLEES